MTQEEIIEMAKQAGCIPRRHPEYWEDVQVFATPEVLQAFAKLVAEAAASKEREEFAVHAVDIARRAVAEERQALAKQALIKRAEEAFAASQQQEQGEPVAWFDSADNVFYTKEDAHKTGFAPIRALYTTPQPKQEQGEPVAVCEFCERERPVIYLPQPKQEQSAERVGESVGFYDAENKDLRREIPMGEDGDWWQPVYTTPQQRTWVGLTDEDIEQEFGFVDELLRDCVQRTEAKLKEKNT
jgi:hypothetical protein